MAFHQIHVRPGVVLTETGRTIVQMMGYCPQAAQLYVTSSKRDEPGSHHNNGDAVDFGFYDDPEPNDTDQRQAREAARWCFSVVGVAAFKEFIHSTPFSDDDGFYIRRGQRVGRSSFGETVARQHVNHIHMAMDLDKARAAVARVSGGQARSLGDGHGVPPWPLPAHHFFGLVTGPDTSHGGRRTADQPHIKEIQQRLQALGHAPRTPGWADGIFEQPTKDAVARWQRARFAALTTRFGEVWSDDWRRLFSR